MYSLGSENDLKEHLLVDLLIQSASIHNLCDIRVAHDELGVPLADLGGLPPRVILVVRVRSRERLRLVVVAVLEDLDHDAR